MKYFFWWVTIFWTYSSFPHFLHISLGPIVIRMVGVCPRLLRRILGSAAVGSGGVAGRRGLCTIPLTDPGAYSRDAVQGSHHYSTLWHQKLGPIFRSN